MNPTAAQHLMPAIESVRSVLMELAEAGAKQEAGDLLSAKRSFRRLALGATSELAALDAALALASAPVVIRQYDPRWGTPS